MPGRAESSSPSAVPSAAAGWQEHAIGDTAVRLALPEGWLAFDQADLADPDVRRQLEADFAGATALFAKLDAQGDRAPLVFLGVDPSERGTGRFPSVVTAVAVQPALPPLLLGIGADLASDAFESTFELETDVTRSDIDTPLGDGIRLQFTHRLVGPEGGPGFAVEPALPPLLLGIGADLASDAFESTFELETDVTRSDIDTPLGDGIRLQFTHRLVGPEGGPGFAVEHDGAIVTTGDETFLVSRNVVPDTVSADTPTLEEILATLRVGS